MGDRSGGALSGEVKQWMKVQKKMESQVEFHEQVLIF